MKWGNWHLNIADRTLDYIENGRLDYQVDLDQCLTAEQYEDWINHLSWKTWVTPTVMYDLVIALRDVLNPQDRFRSGGKITKEALVKYLSGPIPFWK